MKRMNRDFRQENRSLNAALRSIPSRTPQEQIEALDARLGVGQGAKRERSRLARLIGK